MAPLRDPEDLNAALGPVVYETLLLGYSLLIWNNRKKYSRLQHANWPSAEGQIALECAQIRCRALHVVLTGKSSQEGGMSATSDFRYTNAKKTVDQLIRSLEAPGQKESARVLISSRMQARLTGSEFQITAITPEEQAITSKGETEWKWEVKPLTAGDHNLHLTLSALFDVDGKATQRSVQTFDKTITVKVTPGQLLMEFVHDNWQWLWAAILVPSLALIFKRKKQ